MSADAVFVLVATLVDIAVEMLADVEIVVVTAAMIGLGFIVNTA